MRTNSATEMRVLLVGLKGGYQYTRIRDECLKRGHSAVGCGGGDLTICSNRDTFEPMVRGTPMHQFDLIFFATSYARFAREWHTAAWHMSRRFGVSIVNERVLNRPLPFFTVASEYLQQTEAGIAFPSSFFFSNVGNVPRAMQQFSYPVVIKTNRSRQGDGVALAQNEEDIRRFVDIHDSPSTTFILREYIPNDGDLRIFTVGYRAVAGMKRVAREGAFHNNISKGAKGYFFDLSENPEIVRMAERVSQLREVEVAGVDIIVHKETGVPYVLEVNSQPQFTGLETLTQQDVVGPIVDYFERVCRPRIAARNARLAKSKTGG